MLRINMISEGQEVKGQGVGSAYEELVHLLSTYAKDQIALSFNDDKDCDLNHVHTIHPKCFWQMTVSKLPSCMHVHFLPETFQGSIQLAPGIRQFFYQYVLYFYKSAGQLIVVNPIFIDPLVDYGIPREKISYIPNVVSKAAFHPMDRVEDAATLRALAEKVHMPFAQDHFRVLSAGQIQTRKGVLDFIAIAKALPKVEFYWAGGFSFGAITDGYEELSKLVQDPPKNVHFLGIVDREDMNALYNLCDLFLMTSYNELFPMAILEAVNAGLPILLRDLDLYQKIYFSDYPRAENNDAFIAKIQELRDHPGAFARAKAASAKIASDYSEEKTVGLWLDYYKKILTEK